MADFRIQCETDNWLCLGYSIMYQRIPSIKKNNHQEIGLNLHLLPYYIENREAR